METKESFSAGKITVFKSLAISKIIHIAYLSDIPTYVLDSLKKIQNEFIWSGKRAKIKHHTLCNSYETGGLQSVDIETKMNALHIAWIKRLFDPKPQQWKTIPLFYLNQIFGEHTFHPAFSAKRDAILKPLPLFYRNIVALWKNCSTPPLTADCILSQCFWHNEYIKIDNSTFIFKEFELAGLNYLYQIINPNGSIKPWIEIRDTYALNNRLHFKYLQLSNAIPLAWRLIQPDDALNVPNPMKGLIQSTRILPLSELTSKRIYYLIIRKRNHTPTSQASYTARFPELQENDWIRIYTLPRKTTKDTYTRVFQYRILNNVLFLNEKLFQFGLADTNLCSFCRNSPENLMHLYTICPSTTQLWVDLKQALEPFLDIDDLRPQSALLGFYSEPHQPPNLLLNHLLLIFKIYIYNSRNKHTVNINELIEKIKHTAQLELKSSELFYNNDYYNMKWLPLTAFLNM